MNPAVLRMAPTPAAAPEPAPPGDRLSGYLTLLRESLDRLLAGYRQAAGTLAGPADCEAPPDAQAVACVGLRLRPAARALPDGAPGLLPGLGLSAAEEAIMAAAWWSAADPQLGVAFGWVHDDVARRYPSLAALRLLLEPYGLRVPLALPPDSGPVAAGVLRPAADAEAPVRLTRTAALVLDGWRPPAEPDGSVPPRLHEAAALTALLLASGQPVVLRCADPEDGTVLARAVAARLGRALDADAARPAAETALLARLGLVLPLTGAAAPAAPDAMPDVPEAPPGDLPPREVPADGMQNPGAAMLRLAAVGAPAAPGWQVIDVAAISPAGVRRGWRRALSAAGLDTQLADELAARMRLSEVAIDALRRDAETAAAAARRHVTAADLHTAVRGHPRHRLAGMARVLPPAHSLDDLILAPAVRDGLRDLLAHARHGAAVSERWPGSRGRAVVALLHGPSGTGKTAAAEAIARELDRDLWIADLAQVVSKWLGETSRNLDRLLAEAARGGAVLLFDEAEGLFGRRAEVTDARDRYANLEIDHLLQRIELHEGLVLLTSNRPAALDEGFQRRLRLSIRFELPDHAARRQIWAALLPTHRLAPGTDPGEFAAAELSGAGIRAAALSALVFAAAEDALVDAGHLDRAVGRELDKSGRSWIPRARPGRIAARTEPGDRR
jgi:hypothetical protein